MKRYSLQEECGIINVYLAGNGNIHLQQGYLHFSSTSTGPLVCQDGMKSKHFIIEGNKNTIFETMKTKEIFLYIDVTENPPQVIIKSLKDAHFCRFLFKNEEYVPSQPYHVHSLVSIEPKHNDII